MNINYHYFTVKTLARHAGFDEPDAQFIAYFSQHIDDFIMSSPIIVEQKPPEFFLENKLALPFEEDKWIFSPCPTGINMIKSVSHKYQLHTLMPFHFIMSVPDNELPKNPDRSQYRCVTANKNDNLLINRLVEKTLQGIDVKDKNSLMALGMLLHTFADTYAHSGFSGYHGWENESYVAKAEHRLAESESGGVFAKILKFIKEKFLGKPEDSYSVLTPGEISFYRNLPSIGHGNVASTPDYCECTISLYAKKTKDSKLEPLIERDNSEYFADCSRRILDILCVVNKRPLFTDDEWEVLQKKLSEAQNVREQDNQKINTKKWSQVFPDIDYKYSKNEYMDIKLEVLHVNDRLADELEVSKDDIADIFSGEGDQARAACLTLARNVNDIFYKFNELAYRHVFNAVGQHASAGDTEQLAGYRELVMNTNV